MASGGPGSAKNDTKMIEMIKKLQKCENVTKRSNFGSDSCKAAFRTVVENFGRKSSKTHIS